MFAILNQFLVIYWEFCLDPLHYCHYYPCLCACICARERPFERLYRFKTGTKTDLAQAGGHKFLFMTQLWF